MVLFLSSIRRLGAAVIIILMLGGLARAEQHDSNTHAVLDGLFTDLARTESLDAAQPIIQKIWNLWVTDTDDNASILMMRNGIIYMENFDLINAESTFTRIIKRDEGFAEAWNKRATIRFMMGNFDGSERDIAEVLKREPRHFGALSGLAMIKIERGDLLTALAIYEQILLINPHSSDARMLIPKLQKQLRGDPA